MHSGKRWRPILLTLLFLAACSPAASTAVQPSPTAALLATTTPAVIEPSPTTLPTAAEPVLPVEEPTATGVPSDAFLPIVSSENPTAAGPTHEPRKEPKYWGEYPLLPYASETAKEIFRRGQQMGLDPHSFSTIGDCQSEPSVFMGVYDGSQYYLGEGYEHLEETIANFKGSFQRDSVTVKDGMSVASVLAPAWADPSRCQQGETPLACEIRIHRPILLFINLGTNWRGFDDVSHEKYMRQIVDYALSQGVLPVLASKGDNQEGDHRINRSIARVAYDYDLPFWNFWRAIRDLPGKGIDDTREGGYLTTEAWARRSFTGLQALDALWRELSPLIQP